MNLLRRITPNHHARLLLLACLSVMIAMSLRAYVAFRSEAAINVDERYYMSAAATGAAGMGLYPHVLGFEPIPIYPGNGYIIYLYILAYQIFGASVLSLRLVVFIASLLALPPVYLLLRRLYGPQSALLGVALFPWLFFFVYANSIRMDSVTIAYVAWMLYFLFLALSRTNPWWHMAVGLVMGLGLQVHLNTAAVACAFGLLYFVEYVKSARRGGHWLKAWSPLTAYVGGYAISAVIFVAFTMRPDPASFMEILGKIRLWDNEIAPINDPQQRTQSVIRTLASPELLFNKEMTRYRLLFNDAPLFEFVLGLLAVAALLIRRQEHDLRVFVLLVGALSSGAVIFINSSYFYLMHFLPILALPLAPFVYYGFFGQTERTLPLRLAALLLVAVAGSSLVTLTEALGTRTLPADPTPPFVPLVRQLSTSADHIAGPGEYYVQHFPDYPRYTSLEGVEQVIGMILLEVDTPLDYWRIKMPDFVFAPIISADIQGFLDQERYVGITPQVWSNPRLWLIPPGFENPLAVFDGQVAALGIAAQQVSLAPCERVMVMTWWQTLQENVSSDYSLGLYLMDAEGRVIAQNDGPPAGRVWGTWAPFEFASDLREITAPCDAPPGEYQLGLALYHYSTLERLPVTSGQRRIRDNAVEALAITLTD